MTIGLGDHVWSWNGNISLDKNIPKQSGFLAPIRAIRTTINGMEEKSTTMSFMPTKSPEDARTR
jgi:hypothetical protein